MDQNVKQWISLCISTMTLPRLLPKTKKCKKKSRYRPLALLHSFANIISYIYSKFHNDLACIRAWRTRMWNNVSISLCISIKYDGLTLPSLFPRPQKCKSSQDNGPSPSIRKYYKLYIHKFPFGPCIRAVTDQNVKQCTDFAVYFYQIRWFDITAFASKSPKVQEVVEITASGPHPFVCKCYKLYIQQIS